VVCWYHRNSPFLTLLAVGGFERVSPSPNVKIGSRRGVWGNRVSPFPHPREGLGGRSPPRNNRMFIAALCGGAAWTAEVNIGRWSRGVGKPGFPMPPHRRGIGKPGFPMPPPAGRLRGRSPRAGVWGNQVFPYPPPGGRVWKGCALPGTTVCSSRWGAAQAAWTAGAASGLRGSLCKSGHPTAL